MSRTEREREAHRIAEGRRWNRALAYRAQNWTEEDFESEDRRLAEEVAALVAAGEVVRCPTRWADGATSSTLFDI
jgi:hypothetical protein